MMYTVNKTNRKLANMTFRGLRIVIHSYNKLATYLGPEADSVISRNM